MSPSNHADRTTSTADFLALLLASQSKIRAFIFTLTPHWHDADEIYQETSLVLWEKFGQYEQGTDFCAWACRIARNKVMNFRSHRAAASRVFSDDFIEAIAAERIERDDWDDRRRALAGCREKLSPRDRELLDRCYQSDTSVKQAAEELGRPVDTAYKALGRIREALYWCVKRALLREERK